MFSHTCKLRNFLLDLVWSEVQFLDKIQSHAESGIIENTAHG